MTNAPKRIWVEMPEIIDAMGFWQEQEYPGLLPYISLAASDARIEAAVRAGLEAAACHCEMRDHTQGETETKFDQGYDQACDENAAMVRALAADPAAVARIAKEVTP